MVSVNQPISMPIFEANFNTRYLILFSQTWYLQVGPNPEKFGNHCSSTALLKSIFDDLYDTYDKLYVWSYSPKQNDWQQVNCICDWKLPVNSVHNKLLCCRGEVPWWTCSRTSASWIGQQLITERVELGFVVELFWHERLWVGLNLSWLLDGTALADCTLTNEHFKFWRWIYSELSSCLEK